MTEPAVSIKNVSHYYENHRALNEVSVDVAEECFFGLLGPNGSGKTTLFRILSTLMPPTNGSARVLGFDTNREAGEVRKRIGMIFQQPSLDDELTVIENLTFHGRLYGIEKSRLRSRIEKLSTRLGIADRLKSRVKTLSGGLKRRADLVRGILHQPRVLLLDEPTTALDPAARHSFWQLLENLRKEEKLTLILATHLLEEAESCEEIVILDEGNVMVKGNPDMLRNELGEQVLWLATKSIEELAMGLKQNFGFEAQETPTALGITGEAAVRSLPEIYARLGALIESATIRRPTLEDVFLASTGRVFEG